jgi:plasminogen activator inhibitor 1 RNA-binding protein
MFIVNSDSDKKVKQGWGNPETAEAEAATDVLSPSDPVAAEKEVASPAEPEEVVKTLDEYLAEKANKGLKVSLPEARKANDADEAAFKGTVAFAKEELQDFYVSKETKTVKKTEKVRKEKVFVEIEQRFQEKARPEFRKNDRRGGRGNGRRAQKNSASPAVNLEDSSAFPSLGATA